MEIPNKKRIEFSLQYVYGIGHTTAKAILSETVRQLPTSFRALLPPRQGLFASLQSISLVLYDFCRDFFCASERD